MILLYTGFIKKQKLTARFSQLFQPLESKPVN